ncbi:hypothetical protein CTA1_6060 [Colletotrichum tanaceti]|uniref:Uncharacterized protein n=1 Tax=Colletotrichum tanaceti TaxID=1306861 RepID=A0A4V6DFK8_9PEZI|nr:hypothetical protein CTA1_6060 [Colletotrichum tanaceti]
MYIVRRGAEAEDERRTVDLFRVLIYDGNGDIEQHFSVVQKQRKLGIGTIEFLSTNSEPFDAEKAKKKK